MDGFSAPGASAAFSAASSSAALRGSLTLSQLGRFAGFDGRQTDFEAGRDGAAPAIFSGTELSVTAAVVFSIGSRAGSASPAEDAGLSAFGAGC